MNTQRVEGHTPTPWKLWSGGEEGHILSIYSKREDDVIHWTGFDNSVISDAKKIGINKANAAFIVHAVNNIERLEKVNEALATALRKTSAELLELTTGEGCDHSVGICWCDTFRALDEAKEALALAKEPA